MCKIIVVANQKGGVAKTSTIRNLSYSLAELGKRVLTVDFDAQFNLTTCFGIENPNELKHTIATLMTSMLNDEDITVKNEYVMTVGKVDLIPSSILLSVVDANLLETLKPDYDYIIVNTCPSLGTLTINVLTAADEVIIPVNPQILAVMGLQELTQTILKILRRLNPKIQLGGILLTMYDKRTNLYKEISAQVDAAYRSGMMIFDSQIPMTVKVGEANCCGMAVAEYDKKCPAGQAYMDFAREVIKSA